MISHFPVDRFGTMKERFFFGLITKLVPHLLSVLLGTNSAYWMTLTIVQTSSKHQTTSTSDVRLWGAPSTRAAYWGHQDRGKFPESL